ncbi:MAG: hypothetical protein AAGJ79_06035 [Verrucomicrobiota bacterium]
MHEDKLHCRYPIETQTMCAPYRLYLRQTPGKLGVRMVLGGILLAAAAVEYLRGVSAPVVYSLLAFAGIYFLVSPLVWNLILASKNVGGGEVDLTLAADGVTGKVREIPVNVAWNDLKRSKELDAGLYTEWKDGAFLWFDANGFEDAGWKERIRSWMDRPTGG